MRRLLIVVATVFSALLVLWIAALRLLPDAPRGSVPAAATSVIRGATTVATLPVSSNVLAMPVAGIPREALHDSWGDPRDNGLRAHHGTDIMAAPMTPVLAAAPGIIEKLYQSGKGGTTIYQRSGPRDWIFYYAHLAGYAPGLHEGQMVHTGDPIGFVGDTGDAGPGNYHLHFGLTRTAPDQHWYQGEDVDPFPYLAGKQALR